MKLRSLDNEVLEVKPVQKPAFKGKGRTWDVLGTTGIEGKKVELFADTTRGKNVYFEVDDKWYSYPVYDIDKLKKNLFLKVKGKLKKRTVEGTLKKRTVEDYMRIGHNVASGWGGCCVNYEIKKKEKVVTFLCNEHGDMFTTDISFDALDEYDY